MKIAILAKGSTLSKFEGNYDEVWGLNQIGLTHEVDKLFVMDDLKVRLPLWGSGDFAEWLKTYNKPIITSKQYDEWATSEAFPIEEVAAHFGLPLGICMYSTVDYMLALAIYKGATQIDLYGVDCADPKREETIRVSIGMWIGVAMSRGIKVTTKSGSFFQWYTVTGVCYEKGLYGYVGAPRIETLA